MSDMRKLLKIMEDVTETDEDVKQKLDESVIGMVNVPSSLVGEGADGRTRGEYETHITKKSYAPFNPMGDVQMEDEDIDLDDEDSDIDECNEDISVVHEEESSGEDIDLDDDDDEDEVVEESHDSGVDPEILDWMKRFDSLDKS